MKYINTISRCAILYRNDKLENEGLNGYQHTYILKICNNPGISQEQLTRMIYVNKSNVTRQLSLLEQNGFITRKPGEKDKRLMQVFPTQKAYDIYPRVKSFISEWNSYLAEDFTEEERSILLSMLKHIMDKATLKIEKNSEKE
ncbi:MAG: MarR family transcriptional regulator [Sedimentibacter sp.]